MSLNPYESPPIEKPRVQWRARFRWLTTRSAIAAFFFYMASQAIEWAAPKYFYYYAIFLIFRGLVALAALTTMTTTGLFGIGWLLSPRMSKSKRAEIDG